MPTSEQIEKAARAICVAIGLPPDECTFGSGGIVHGGQSSFTCYRYRWQEFSAHASAALSAAEGVKPRAITVSDRLAEELKTWAEDERAAWPKDTAYQDDLADLVSQLSALQEGE